MSEPTPRWTGPDMGPSPRELDGTCIGCGARGTVARAWRPARADSPAEVRRYCDACWPSAAADLEEAGGWAWTSRSWHDVATFLGLLATVELGEWPATPAGLKALAAEIRETAEEMVGPMPESVAAFLARHDPPAV